MNFRTMFYIFDHFKLSWDPPNMIFDPSESSHDVCVHLRPPAQLSPLDQTWAMMHVRVRPGGRRFNLQRLLYFKSVFGHVSLLLFSQNRCTKSCPIRGDNSALKALWRLGSCSLRMPWLPHDARKRILANSTKVAPRLSP